MPITTREVPENWDRDTRREMMATHVVLNVQVRDGGSVTGYKKYVTKEAWYSASGDDRAAAISEAAEYLAQQR